MASNSHEKESRGRCRKRQFKIGFLLFVLLQIGVTVELFYRFVHPIQAYGTPQDWQGNDWAELVHNKSEIPGLHYELAPNVRANKQVGQYEIDIKTNRYGMRDDEPIAPHQQDVFRIVALGDSFAFGWGVSEGSQTFPNLLEEKLKASPTSEGYQFEVLNFGTAGYSTRQEAILLKHKALRWEPKLVLLQYFLNDPEQEPFHPLVCRYREPSWWQYSYLGRALALAKHNWDIQRIGGGDYYTFLHANNRKEWESVVKAFRDIREATSPRGIPVLLVLFPDPPPDGWHAYRYEWIHEKVASTASATGFSVVDLLEVFRRHEPNDLKLAHNDQHPTPLAHSLAADAIYAELTREFSFLLSDGESLAANTASAAGSREASGLKPD